MSLPSGYKLLEYIQSTGTQCINTELAENSVYGIRMKFTVPSLAVNYQSLLSGTLDTGFTVGSTTKTTGLYVRLRGGEVLYNDAALSSSVNELVIKGGKISINGAQVETYTAGALSSGSGQFYVFNNNAKSRYSNMFLYELELYDSSGATVRKYVASKRNSDNAIGMYDLVSNTFYGNAGTGTFTAGPVLAIAANASEITELEYIQSSGTQYVDSRFIPNGESTVEIAFESAVISSATSGNYPVYGAASNYNSNAFELWSLANGFCTYGSQAYKSGFGLSANVRYISKQAKNVLEINNQTLTFTKQTFSAPYSLLLFATHRDSEITISGSDAKLKIYFCKIYDNGTLVRDYVAAKLSDGTIGLYDKLHGLLYINMGTGTFIAGPAVTSSSIFVNINGIWKPINNIYVNINNIWQEAT